jgi:hypothetical protein
MSQGSDRHGIVVVRRDATGHAQAVPDAAKFLGRLRERQAARNWQQAPGAMPDARIRLGAVKRRRTPRCGAMSSVEILEGPKPFSRTMTFTNLLRSVVITPEGREPFVYVSTCAQLIL